MNSSNPVLVTGATGSIGSVLAKRLSESGQAVRALVRNPERAAALRGLANVEIVPGDLGQLDSLRGCAEGCWLVYHCAAKLSGSDRAASRTINVAGTQAVIEEAVRAGVERFIHASTIGVYGFSNAKNITEEYPFPPCDWPYVVTKREAESVVWKYTPPIQTTVARFGDVIGPGQHIWTVNFIERINQGLMNPPVDSASGTLNPVYIDNLIDALLLMSTHPAALGQVFNVVDGTPLRMSDYIRRLTQMAGKRTFAVPAFVLKSAATLLMWNDLLRGREAETTPDDVRYLLHKATINADKIRGLLGWTPAVDLEEGFRRTEQWLRQAGYISSK
jgi:nucleoside-diphosphate-sugar epimerase